MSGGMYGADVAQLRETASHVSSCAERLAQVRTALGAAVDATRWEGPDASRFRSEWQGAHSAALLAAESRLREAAAQLQRNAAAQEATSTADGGSAGMQLGYIASTNPSFVLPDETGGVYRPLPAPFPGGEVHSLPDRIEYDGPVPSLPAPFPGGEVHSLPDRIETDLTLPTEGDGDDR